MIEEEAIIFAEELDADAGDTLVRALPGNKEEAYLILDAHYSASFDDFPAYYKLRLRKNSTIRPSAAVTKNTTVSINNSTGIQVGDHNTLQIHNAITELIHKIDSASASSGEKAEAKGRLSAFLTHPLITSVLGAAAPALLGELFK